MECDPPMCEALPRPANFSMQDMIILNNIMQEVERDQNLSMLPDDFKQLAIETMFDEYKARERQRAEGVDISNKRMRRMNSTLEDNQD